MWILPTYLITYLHYTIPILPTYMALSPFQVAFVMAHTHPKLIRSPGVAPGATAQYECQLRRAI